MIAELHSLLESELSYAYFNARRTTDATTDGTILRGRHQGVPYIIDTSRPRSEYYNRAVIPPDVTALADFVQQLPVSVQAIELLFPQQTETNVSCLLKAGFAPASSLCYLAATPESTPSLEWNVVELGPNQTDYFFDLLELGGTSLSDKRRSNSSRFYCNEEFRCFVAYDSDAEPAGWATMYVGKENAFLANAFTLPEHRGRGCHSALLSARLNLASKLQLTQAFTDVEPASQSHRNCLRCGFRLLSVNNIWRRIHKDRPSVEG